MNIRGDAQKCFSKNNLSLKERVLQKEPDSKACKTTRTEVLECEISVSRTNLVRARKNY